MQLLLINTYNLSVRDNKLYKDINKIIDKD